MYKQNHKINYAINVHENDNLETLHVQHTYTEDYYKSEIQQAVQRKPDRIPGTPASDRIV